MACVGDNHRRAREHGRPGPPIIANRGGVMSETVGFVGLGVMGRPMAKHILARGYAVAVHNRSRAAVDELVAAGATAGASAADVARRATVVISMVPDTPDVEAVIAGS